MDIAVLLLTMFFCFLIGVPIAYSLGLAAIAASLWIGIPLEAVMLQISNGVSKVAMLTIPFFVLAGAIMAEGGMARRMVAFADVLVGFTRVRGGLSVVNVLATTLLSGISGSSVADVSAIGSVMIPQMERSGYPRVYATNVTITGSVQALLVPPSHNAIIYSLATGGSISIISLFIAGVVPGLLLGFSIMVLCLVIAYRDGHPKGTSVPLRDAVKISIEAAWGLITLVIILGGILGGIFTAIEAGAVACMWAFFVTMFIYRDYKWRDLPILVHRTLRTVAMVMTLIACASSVGYVMALTQMPAKITAFFLTISSNKYVILMLINILLLVLGCLVDMAPSILICTPILLPVMINFGVDPVHFGMIMMLNLGIGLCHPPVGAILFVGCAVGKVTIEQVMRTIWPFYGVMFVVLMLVTYIPALSLWLPSLVIP
jgi:tripartite ATP-independent transporter DctM subunit